MGAGTHASAVGERLAERLDEVLAVLDATYRAEIPEYAALSADDMASRVLPISRGIAEAFVTSLRHDRPPSVDDVPGLDAIGVQRVRIGMPLEPMLHAFRVFGRVVWTEMAQATGPDDAALLADLGGRWMDWIDRASSSAATAYLDASNELVRRIDARRGALLEALLEAASTSDAVAVATEFQMTLADSYVPIAIAGGDATIRIDDVVATAPAGTIAGNRPSGLWLLVPGGSPELSPLVRAGDAQVVAHGVAAAPGAPLAHSAHETQQLLSTAQRLGVGGVVGPDDLLLERLVVDSNTVPRWLDDHVLRSLRDGDRSGNIEPTLVAYLRTGSVPATAAEVHAHGNTVAYRLGRVAELTGFDPRIPAQAAVLQLAVVRGALRADQAPA